MKQFVFFVLTIISNNNLLSMNEAKPNSLASFFDIDQFCSIKDITKHITDCSFVDKQWWYVDKEIQFYHRDHYYANSAGAMANNTTKRKIAIDRLYFSRCGTKIIVYPDCSSNLCDHCMWDRYCIWDKSNENELDRISMDIYGCVCNDPVKIQIGRSFQLADMFSRQHCVKEREKLFYEKHDACDIYLNKSRNSFVVRMSTYNKRSFFDENIVCVWDREQDKEILQLVHNDRVYSAYFNPNDREIITASKDGTIRLWHAKTGKELLRITYDTPVRSAVFNEQETEFVVGTDDGKIQVFSQYHPQHLSQILLKKLLQLWMQIEKPSKKIDSLEKLLNNIAALLHCDKKELFNAWNLFPESMQNAIWLSMSKKIQRYGK